MIPKRPQPRLPLLRYWPVSGWAWSPISPCWCSTMCTQLLNYKPLKTACSACKMAQFSESVFCFFWLHLSLEDRVTLAYSKGKALPPFPEVQWRHSIETGGYFSEPRGSKAKAQSISPSFKFCNKDRKKVENLFLERCHCCLLASLEKSCLVKWVEGNIKRETLELK